MRRRGRSGIYEIRNTGSDKVYIGSAVDLASRKASHFHHLRHGTHKNRHLQAAFRRDGEAVFTWTVVELVPDVHDLIAREQAHIDRLRAFDRRVGYNSAPIAGSCLGVIPGPETRALWSKIRIGRRPSEETKAKMRESQRGKVISIEQRAKMSAALKGRVISPAWRAKLSASLKGRKRSAEAIESARLGFLGTKKTNKAKWNHFIAAIERQSRMTPALVAEIFERHERGEGYGRIGKAMGFGRSTIAKVLTRPNWREFAALPYVTVRKGAQAVIFR